MKSLMCLPRKNWGSFSPRKRLPSWSIQQEFAFCASMSIRKEHQRCLQAWPRRRRGPQIPLRSLILASMVCTKLSFEMYLSYLTRVVMSFSWSCCSSKRKPATAVALCLEENNHGLDCVPNREYCQHKPRKCSSSTMAEILFMFSFGVAYSDSFSDC